MGLFGKFWKEGYSWNYLPIIILYGKVWQLLQLFPMGVPIRKTSHYSQLLFGNYFPFPSSITILPFFFPGRGRFGGFLLNLGSIIWDFLWVRGFLLGNWLFPQIIARGGGFPDLG